MSINTGDSEERVGSIHVDAGLCWVGDPCYVLGDNASSKVTDWGEFCGKLHGGGETHSNPLGEGTGIAISTGYGDGEYPVYIRKNSEGRVAEIRIVFIKENPARVPTRPDTIVSGIVCSSCSMEVPPHTVREHLDVDNPIHKCPHPSPERLQLEQ